MRCVLSLALGTIESGAIREGDLFDHSLASTAWFALPVIDLEALLEVAGLSIFAQEIPQGSATLFNSVTEYLLDLLCEDKKPAFGYVASFTLWVNCCSKQCLASIDVTHTYHHLVIHDVLLDRCFAVFANRAQIISIKSLAEGLRSQVIE